MRGRGRLLLVAAPGLSLVLAGCTAGPPQAPAPAPAPETSAEGPCGATVAERRPTARLRPDNAPVRAAGLRGAGVRVVELADPDGLCLVLDPGTVPFGWEVEARRLTAQAGPRRWSWESSSPAGESGRGAGMLVVPVAGCVEVTAAVRLHGPGGVAGDWAVQQTYGRDCARGPRAATS